MQNSDSSDFFVRVWETVDLTRRRQDAKKEERRIVHQSTTTDSIRDSTYRFDWRPEVKAQGKSRLNTQEGIAN
ncbi:MAG: hypothetical protein ACK5ZC_01435 [Pirellulaceae bacterium]